MGRKLAKLHCVVAVVPARGGLLDFAFKDHEIESLAQLEHARWQQERLRHGPSEQTRRTLTSCRGAGSPQQRRTRIGRSSGHCPAPSLVRDSSSSDCRTTISRSLTEETADVPGPLQRG